MLNRFVNARTVLVIFLVVNCSIRVGLAADDAQKQIQDAKKRLWSKPAGDEAKAGRDQVPQIGGEWSNIVDGKAAHTINIVQKGDKFTATCSYQHPQEGEIRWSLTATITKEGHISGRMVHTKAPKGWKNQQHIAVLSAEGNKIKGAVVFDGGGGHDYLWTLSKAAVEEKTDPEPAKTDPAPAKSDAAPAKSDKAPSKTTAKTPTAKSDGAKPDAAKSAAGNKNAPKVTNRYRAIELTDKAPANWLFNQARVRSFLWSDREYAFTALPKEMAGGALLLHDTGHKGWLPAGVVRATKDCVVYAVIRWKHEDKVLVDEVNFVKLAREGWEEVDGDVRTNVDEPFKQRWKAVRKKMNAGDVTVPLETIDFSNTEVKFIFKEAKSSSKKTDASAAEMEEVGDDEPEEPVAKKADQPASGSEKPTASNSSNAKKPMPDNGSDTKDKPPENPGKNEKGHIVAKAGQPFKYQMPPDKKRTDYRLSREPDGMKITDEGLITWNPGIELSGVFDITLRINGSTIIERLKIEVEPASAAAIAAYKKAPTAAAAEVPGLTDRPGYGYIPLGAIGGWVMLPDNVTLVCSLPEEGRLVYFDTLANKQLKDVEVDFKPGPLALQGKTLFAGGKGGSIVYALDVQTGKELRQFTLGSDAVARVACHPEKGPVFASTITYGVYALDPKSGKTSKTTAKGFFLAVDPVSGGFLYAGVQPQVKEEFVIREDASGDIHIEFDKYGKRSILMKYAIEGNRLKLVSSQNNAAVNGWDMHLSPDGKKVMMVGGGGWRPLRDGTGGGYVVAVFGTDNLEGMLGQAPQGANIAIHPVLNIGVTNHYGLDLTIFNAKSFVVKYGIHMSKDREDAPLLLTFGARGTKIVVWNGTNVAKSRGLHLVPLDLSDDDKKTLEQAYSKKKTTSTARNSATKAVAQASEPDEAPSTDEKPGDDTSTDEKPANEKPTVNDGKKGAFGQEPFTIKAHKSEVTSVKFTPDGKRIVSGSSDETVKILDADSGNEIHTLTGHSDTVLGIAISPDGKRIASGSKDATIKIWDAASGKESTTLTGHENAINSVAFSPDGKQIVSGSWDSTVKVWDAASGKTTRTLQGHIEAVNSVVFSPDGKRIASSSMDKTARVWDLASGKASATFKGHTGWVLGIAFSPDGKQIASTSDDKTVKIWDASNGKEIRTLNGHTSTVQGVAFRFDGKQIATGDWDETVKVWDAASGAEILTLKSNAWQITSVAFSPDGQRLVAAGRKLYKGGPIDIWTLNQTGRGDSAAEEPLTANTASRPEDQPQKTSKVDDKIAAASTATPATKPAARPILGKQPGEERDDNESKIALIWCSPGKFKMGSPKSEKGRAADREDQVDVSMTKGFWLGKYEVTQSEWNEGMATEPWQGKDFTKAGDNFPATWVNWDDAMKFCAAMTERERDAGRLPDGWEYTLPTEAQWEYACRAGTETSYCFGGDESKLGQYAWFEKNTSLVNQKYAHEACQKKTNYWGFQDMHGNVQEWCRDCFVKKLPGGVDPEVTAGDSSRVVRSTSFRAPAGDCRSARRVGSSPGQRVNDIGFRVALCQTGSN